MLVLTRKRTEKIHIGNDIVIKVIKTGRSTVKLGIEAPPNVRVMRAELCADQAPAIAKPEDVAAEATPNARETVLQAPQFPHAV